MSPEPVGSTHLRFGDARVVYMQLPECCSKSRMISRTSRGVLEWSVGKELYIGSEVSAIGKVLGVTGIVPGPPEGSRGPPGGATYPGGPHGLKWEGNQPLVGWFAPSPLAHEALQHLSGLPKHLSVMLAIAWYPRNTSGLQYPSSNISIFTAGPFRNSS